MDRADPSRVRVRGDEASGTGTGRNVHVVATVLTYNSDQCLFFLAPVSTTLR